MPGHRHRVKSQPRRWELVITNCSHESNWYVCVWNHVFQWTVDSVAQPTCTGRDDVGPCATVFMHLGPISQAIALTAQAKGEMQGPPSSGQRRP